MKVLAIGDVVGSVGCKFLMEKLPQLKRKENINFVVCNGENSSDGNGITPASAKLLFSAGVDVITGGNHSFRRKETYPFYDECECLLRPANFPEKTTPGRGYVFYDMGRTSLLVINLMGCMYMESLDCPFKTADKILEENSRENNAKIIIVDFHAEATAEKLALGYYLDGRVSAIFGTHTHVQTADEMILPKGTGYITDVGMTGPIISVLGVKPEITIKKFVEKLPVRFDLAENPCKLDCILYDIDEKTGSTVSLKRIEIR